MSQAITFFYQPNRLRKSELAFFQALKSFYPNSQTLNQHFLVNADLVNQFVDSKKLADWLKKDSYLPTKKRLLCLEIIKKLPSESIRVARQPSEISFDVVAKTDNEIYYWEFHEKQHVGLSVDRPKNVYTPDGIEVEVPRYFQRLVRDIWRVCYFSSYTVVWKNWFEKSENTSESLKLSKDFREFSLDEKFSFRRFIFE